MSGGGGGGGDQVAGHRYYMGVHMAVCRGPVDEIVEIRVGDRTLTLREGQPVDTTTATGVDENGNPTYTTSSASQPVIVPGSTNKLADNALVYVDSYELFGGEAKEGGIQGTMDVLMGGPAQTVNPGVQAMNGGGPMPAWRKVVTLFFNGIVCMVNPYPKAWKFRVRRHSKGWHNDTPFDPTRVKIVMTGEADGNYPASPSTIEAMNPAAIVYECLTNPEWGRGLPASRIDEASFLAASQTLYNEGFGLCLKWARTGPIDQFVQSVLNTIAANIYQDRATGKIVLKLVRGDYTFSALPLFDTSSGLLDITEATFGAPTDSINEMALKWHDPVSNLDRTVTLQNLAAVQSAGGAINSTSRDFTGIPTAALAKRVAQRELKAASTPLRRFTLTLDRRGWQVYPGSVIRIRDLSRNIPDMAVRIAQVAEGGLVNGKIQCIGVQDVFAMPATALTGQQPSAWTPPNFDPCLGQMRLIEIPYFTLVKYMTPADFAALTPGSARLGVLVAEGQGLNTGYDIAVRDGAPTSDDASLGSTYYCGYTP